MYKKFMVAKSVEFELEKNPALPNILRSLERTSSKGNESIGTNASKAVYS